MRRWLLPPLVILTGSILAVMPTLAARRTPVGEVILPACSLGLRNNIAQRPSLGYHLPPAHLSTSLLDSLDPGRLGFQPGTWPPLGVPFDQPSGLYPTPRPVWIRVKADSSGTGLTVDAISTEYGELQATPNSLLMRALVGIRGSEISADSLNSTIDRNDSIARPSRAPVRYSLDIFTLLPGSLHLTAAEDKLIRRQRPDNHNNCLASPLQLVIHAGARGVIWISEVRR